MALHFVVPGIVACLGFRDRWKQAWLLMLGTMVVDLDHLLATPVFDAARCSVGTHLMHTAPAIASYVALICLRRTRVVGIGLVLHMALDAVDCVWMRLE
ncbi:MAG: DUF6122 family protein [Polyangiaceae bacterium]|nr:DUF6122 family protein [Polyangiaceae bacterium]